MPTYISPERLNATKRYKKTHPECEVCGWPRHVHCHHIVPISSGGTNGEDNLIALCANHHADAHGSVPRTITTRQELKDYLVSLGPIELSVILRRRRVELERTWSDLTDEERNERVVAALAEYVRREREDASRERSVNAVLVTEGRERDRLIGELLRRAATNDGEQMALFEYRLGRRSQPQQVGIQ